MQKKIYQLSVILVLLQSHAADFQFVSASPHLGVQERMKAQCVAVVATGEPAHYGFQKSKGRTGQAADAAGTRAHAVLEGGLSSGDALVAVGSIAWSPAAAADDALDRAVAESDMQEHLRNQVVQLVGEQNGARVVLVKKPLPEGVG